MVRTSAPASRRWTAKACRKLCGVIGLDRPESSRAFAKACPTASLVIGGPAVVGVEPFLRPLHLPVIAQDLQELRRQHHIAVLLAFALLDTDHQSLAVDIRELQLNRFRNAQTPRHSTSSGWRDV